MKSVRLTGFSAIVVMSIAAGAAHALEYKSIGAAPAVLYDAPAAKGRKMFVAPRGMPVEIVLTYGNWTKVRDASGDLSWVDSKSLSTKRTVMVAVLSAKARTTADDAAPIVFTAEKGVLLDLLEPAVSGWVKVKHRDGLVGFVKAIEVWGD